MPEDTDEDGLLAAFDKKAIARRNLRCLDQGKSKDASKKDSAKPTPALENEEEERPPFHPG